MLFSTLNRYSADQKIKINQQEIYHHTQSDGKKIQIFIDNKGHLTGRILHQGKILHAKIKGLPEIISLNHLDNVKKMLHLDCQFKIMFDNIEVIPKLRGGEPFTLSLVAFYLSIAACGGITGGAIVAAITNQQPKIEVKGNFTVQNSHGNNNQNNSSPSAIALDSWHKKVNGKTAMIISGALLLSLASYCGYYYMNYLQRNKKDDQENSPLHRAVLKEDKKEVLKLLNADSTFMSYFKPSTDINTLNIDGDTALHLAVRSDSPDIVAILVRNKADPYIKNKKGEVPYNMAFTSSSEAMKIAIGITSVAYQNQELK